MSGYKFLPKFLRDRFNDKMKSLIAEQLKESQHQVSSIQINEMEKMLLYVRNRMYMELPELITISPEMRKVADDFLKRNNLLSNLNLSLSKNDLMFHYSLLHVGSILSAFESYLAVGHQGFTIIQQIARQAFGGLKNTGNVLDFASGYGRITRFLIQEHEAEKVWVSDIKQKAVDFQKKSFGVQGFASVYQPLSMKVEERFDLIFVGSLFSHLPITTFREWLIQLKSMLTPRGILAFSVHDTSLFGVPTNEPFIFHPSSEDITFKEVEDHIDKSAEYGITYCAENYVNMLCKELFMEIEMHRFPKLFGGLQDIYCISDKKYALTF